MRLTCSGIALRRPGDLRHARGAAFGAGDSRLPLGGLVDSWTNELVSRLGFLVCASDVLWHRSAEAWRPPLRFEAAFSGANVRAGERFSKLTINLINECRSWLV